MYIGYSLKLLADDLRFKSGIAPFLLALVASSLILVLIAVLVFSFFNGTWSFMGLCAGITLMFYMINSLGQGRRLEQLEGEVKKDKIKIEKLSKREPRIKKDSGINVENLNKMLKDFNEEE
jgi:amino acid permease